MSTITGLKSATPTAKWRWRHQKLYFNLWLATFMAAGAMPGILTFVVFLMAQSRVQLSFLQTASIFVVGYALLVIGALIGCLAGYAYFIAEKICFPENTNQQRVL